MGDLKKRKKGKKSKKGLGFIIFLMFSAGIGFLMGWLSNGILGDFFDSYISSDLWYMEIFKIILILLIFIFGLIIHIFIHEGGHLVFGLLSGYEFVSFRVGSFVLIREDGRLKMKRYSLPGTGGQCLMMPPEKKDGDFPYIIYNLGGALANIIVSLISIFIAVNLKELSWIKVILILSSVVGILTALTNAIPLKIAGIANDGHNIRAMIRDKDSRESFYLQLRINGLLSKGIRIKDMPYDQLILREDIDYKNPLNFSRIFLNHNYHLDKMDFEKAKEALVFGEKYDAYTIEIYRMELRAEMLFLELIEDCSSERIEELYTKRLEKYIVASKFMLNKKRIMMAYEILYKKNQERGWKYFQELKELADKYPIRGEADMELMLADYLKDMIET